MADLWTMPEYLEPYRSYIRTGYAHTDTTIEQIMTEFYEDADLISKDQYKVQCAVSIADQVTMLQLLHQDRMLRDLSAWVCKTPYPESGKFCGGPREHPSMWGCGYERVE